AREFIQETGEVPWLCHLSYIKPHWPYMAPAPYHNMYGPNTFQPIIRDSSEKINPHPVYNAFMEMEVSQTFSTAGVRETVLPAYMGMIKQIDDHLGNLFGWLEESGKADETMIVVTSDHGDYLGDHWLGEKELFHEVSVRVPLIIYDPRPEANKTRGKVVSELVEAIDLVPTFLAATGAPSADHRLEGSSLEPLIHGEFVENWRSAVFSEIDYSYYKARDILGVGNYDARGYMVRTNDWKYIYFRGFEPQLFNLNDDPNEFQDLGRDVDYEETRRNMHAILLDRLTGRKNRVALSDEALENARGKETSDGILIGKW
ncbi:MAG: sulfatase-like hydrolase/transferase, partial [Rhodobacteraceae bacterium]|nr:sulfatase-like hydrolase/transferase [Paracoccaceae bacterium]